jgi:hypothetical protein
MSAHDIWPEALRQYVDMRTGRLRFRRRPSFSAWLFLAGSGGLAILALGFTIFSATDRGDDFRLLLVFGVLCAVLGTSLFLPWAEIERGDREWIVHRGFASWRRRTIRFRDDEIMTVFVGSMRAWPDFEPRTHLAIEFSALPFAGAPPALVILKGLRVPELDLAHLGKLILELAGKPAPSSTNIDVSRAGADQG